MRQVAAIIALRYPLGIINCTKDTATGFLSIYNTHIRWRRRYHLPSLEYVFRFNNLITIKPNTACRGGENLHIPI